MTKEQSVELMTDKMAKFVAYVGKKLPDDVEAKLQELRQQETTPLATAIYDTMARNQKLAVDLNRPCCQDTGVLQFWVKCGVNFPLMGELEALLKEAVVRATFAAPLRHNSVETFDEVNTKRNVGKGTPTVFWDIVPDDDHCEIYTYMAGGGCTLPGKAMVLMPGMGYEGVTKFVLDQMTSYGLNACPPLLVGVGVATSVETAALLSKKALMRPLGSHNPNPRAAEMEKLLEDGINSIGLGPQGMSGKNSVMGVLALSDAIQKTGAGDVVADWMIKILGGTTNTYLIMAVFFLVPFVLTQVMSNLATLTIFIPLVTSACLKMGLDPRAAVVGVITASCISIMTPMAAPCQIMIIEPGGYKLKDYLKCGTPLAALLCMMSILVLPMMFPLYYLQ